MAWACTRASESIVRLVEASPRLESGTAAALLLEAERLDTVARGFSIEVRALQPEQASRWKAIAVGAMLFVGTSLAQGAIEDVGADLLEDVTESLREVALTADSMALLEHELLNTTATTIPERTDRLLTEIDDALEEEEQHVKNYVQRGGE